MANPDPIFKIVAHLKKCLCKQHQIATSSNRSKRKADDNVCIATMTTMRSAVVQGIYLYFRGCSATHKIIMLMCGLEVSLGEYVSHAEADKTNRMKRRQETKYLRSK